MEAKEINNDQEQEYEFLLQDRIGVIKQTILKHGEDKFYLSFSGGKDSTAMSYLLDLALPNNKIPRVYVNTGIEYFDIINFVKEMQQKDNRIVIIQPSNPIKETLEKVGYPFKSKVHSALVDRYQRIGMCKSIDMYLNHWTGAFRCPNKLRYQFTSDYNIKTSNKCCLELKKKPASKWAKENKKTIVITGMLAEEGGSRMKMKGQCIFTDKDGNITKFHPFMKVDKHWEEWFIKKYNIKLCKLYYPPYNFSRTGCKGCPFNKNIRKEMETLIKLLPNEAKQCEFIWKPIYEEYRKIGYRLKKDTNNGL